MTRFKTCRNYYCPHFTKDGARFGESRQLAQGCRERKKESQQWHRDLNGVCLRCRLLQGERRSWCVDKSL